MLSREEFIIYLALIVPLVPISGKTKLVSQGVVALLNIFPEVVSLLNIFTFSGKNIALVALLWPLSITSAK